MRIRQLTDKDMYEALNLVWAVFCEFEAPEYDPAGVAVFRKFLDDAPAMMAAGKLHFWGSFMGDVLAGVIAARDPSHISLLFVRKEFHRRGIARALFTVVEGYYRLAGCDSITVNSSPYAIPVYHRLGFTDTSKETVTDGIRFTQMIYDMNT